MEKRESFQQMVLEPVDIHMRKKQNLDADLTPFTKINSWWATGLNLNCKNTRFLDDDVGENLDDLWYGSKFLDTKPKTQSIKKKKRTDKLDFSKIKIFCFVKGTVKRMKR